MLLKDFAYILNMIELWVIFAFLSAITVAISGVLSKKILKNIETNQLMIEEYLFMLIFVIIFWSKKVECNAFLLHWDLFIFKAFILFSFGYLYFNMLRKYEISTISPLLNLSPIFLIIISSIFLNETITYIQLFGIFIIIIATYFLEVNFHIHHDKKNKTSLIDYYKKISQFDWKVIWLTIFMLILISFAAVADKKLFNYVNVYTNMFYTSIIIFIGLFFNYLRQKKIKTVYTNLKNNPLLIVFATFKFISTFFILKALAIPTAMASLVIPIKRTSTLFSSLIGGVIFHEKHLIKKIIAICIMLIGVFIITI